MGDSAEVLDLLARMKRPGRQPTSPIRAASLQRVARGAPSAPEQRLGEGDRPAAAGGRRIDEPYTWYYPLTSMAPERRLLGRLLEARTRRRRREALAGLVSEFLVDR